MAAYLNREERPARTMAEIALLPRPYARVDQRWQLSRRVDLGERNA